MRTEQTSTSNRKRSAAWLPLILFAAIILALSLAQIVSAATATTSAWQAKIGTLGANGTANLATISTGAGSVGLKLVKLRPSSLLPVAVYKGTCASIGTVLFKLPSIKTTTSGAASRTTSLTSAQVNLLLAATSGTGKIALRVGSGSSATCGAFARRTVLGPQAVVQAFYNWYVAQVGVIDLAGRPDLTPAFVYWAEHYNDGNMFGADPVLCGQGQPQWVKAGPTTLSGSIATVKVTQGYAGEDLVFLVKLTLGPTGWRISKGGC